MDALRTGLESLGATVEEHDTGPRAKTSELRLDASVEAAGAVFRLYTLKRVPTDSAVWATVTLHDADYDELVGTAEKRVSFGFKVVDSLAQTLGLDKRRIRIEAIRRGGVVGDVSMLVPSSDTQAVVGTLQSIEMNKVAGEPASVVAGIGPRGAITLSAGPNIQRVSLRIPIAPIVYDTKNLTGVRVTGLPAGVSGVFANNRVTISGTPSEVGTFDYTVTSTGGNGFVEVKGTITVDTATGTFTLLSATGTDNQTVAFGAAIEPIVYGTKNMTGATVTGDPRLPDGVYAAFIINQVSISGVPS